MKILLLRWRCYILRGEIEHGAEVIEDHQRRMDNMRAEQRHRESELRRTEARIDALARPRTLIAKIMANMERK